MEKFELDAALSAELEKGVFGEGFVKLVQSVRRGGRTLRTSLRPVLISGKALFQEETFEDGRVKVRNLEEPSAREAFAALLAAKGARDLHLMTTGGDLHVRVTKKGRALASRSAAARPAASLEHDRRKKTPLDSFDSGALLKACGIADADGRIRASMRGKYDQINEFLKVVAETVPPDPARKSFTVVDCGCGKAYLSLALYFYLSETLGIPGVKIIGVNRRRDVVESASAAAESLGIAGSVSFAVSDLAAFDAEDVDMVVSLHACDTATDEALAKAVEWRAKYVLSAPCCQHELQKTLSDKGAFAGLMRHSILRERLCDILTDVFRAQIMRILGYRVNVSEFVSSEATARNIMLKCVWGVKPGQGGPVAEYLSLRDYWHVAPWLETRLSSILGGHLARYS